MVNVGSVFNQLSRHGFQFSSGISHDKPPTFTNSRAEISIGAWALWHSMPRTMFQCVGQALQFVDIWTVWQFGMLNARFCDYSLEN